MGGPSGRAIDLLAVGRISLDLFSLEVGAPFERIPGFDTRVGGSPSNVAIGASRLGLRSTLFSAVGPDRVGDAVVARLMREGVDTRLLLRKPESRTGLALLGIEPPGRFPLVFYREQPADVLLELADLDRLPLADTRALLLSGTALARDPVRTVTFHAAERAQAHGATVFLDLDLRPDQWRDVRAYGVDLRALLTTVDVAIGTEEEWHAALTGEVVVQVDDDARTALDRSLATRSAPAVAVVKRGPAGVSVFVAGDRRDVPGFPVEVVNTVGAGDAFAAGLIHGWLTSGDWQHSLRQANACGAIQVTRPGCSDTMPYLAEVEAFLERQP